MDSTFLFCFLYISPAVGYVAGYTIARDDHRSARYRHMITIWVVWWYNILTAAIAVVFINSYFKGAFTLSWLQILCWAALASGPLLAVYCIVFGLRAPPNADTPTHKK